MLPSQFLDTLLFRALLPSQFLSPLSFGQLLARQFFDSALFGELLATTLLRDLLIGQLLTRCILCALLVSHSLPRQCIGTLLVLELPCTLLFFHLPTRQRLVMAALFGKPVRLRLAPGILVGARLRLRRLGRALLRLARVFLFLLAHVKRRHDGVGNRCRIGDGRGIRIGNRFRRRHGFWRYLEIAIPRRFLGDHPGMQSIVGRRRTRMRTAPRLTARLDS